MYYVASTLFPAKETYMLEAVLADDAAAESDERDSEDLEKVSIDKHLRAEVKSTLSSHDA